MGRPHAALCRGTRAAAGDRVNLHHLRIFHTLATTGSFTGAARRLGTSQPVVTIQVRELEETSGVRLPGALASKASQLMNPKKSLALRRLQAVGLPRHSSLRTALVLDSQPRRG